MRSKQDKKKLIISVVAGLVASFAVLNTFNSMNDKLKVQQTEILRQSNVIAELQRGFDNGGGSFGSSKNSFEYVVAKDSIKSGTIITATMLETQKFSHEVPSAFYVTANVVGKLATKDIFKGQAITAQDAVNSTFDGTNMPPGARIITIPTTYVQGLASYLKVGTRVDVLSSGDEKEEKPKIILQNVRIVSLEPRTPTSSSDKPSTPVSAIDAGAITLQIPVKASTKVVNAMLKGKLIFIARGDNDNGVLIESESTARQNSNSIRSYSNAPKINSLPSLPKNLTVPASNSSPSSLPEPARPMASTTSVEMIQAGVKSEMTFNGN